MGIASLGDASHLSKFWAQSIQRFGRSIDWKLEAISWATQFLLLCVGRTVCGPRTDSPCGSSLSRVLRLFVRDLGCSSFDPWKVWVFVARGLADSPSGTHGQSMTLGPSVPRGRLQVPWSFWRSLSLLRTVRGLWRTVREP